MLQPNIPHGYKATALGIIPQEWEVKSLNKACDFLDSQRIPIKDSERAKISGIYPYYGASGIIDYVNNYIFNDDLILLAEDGANIINRSTPIAFLVNGKIWVNNHAHVLKAKPSFDRYYLCAYLESLKYDKYNTGTAQPKLNREVCEKIPILAPPLAEQRKIAEVLGVWDEAVEKQARLIEKLALRKRGLMQRLLTGKLRLPNFNEEWRNTIFSSVIEKMSNGYTYDVNGVGNVPITRIETISKGIIDYSKVGNVLYIDELEKYKLHRGDILFSHINSIEHIGKVAIFEGDEDLYHGMNLLLIRTKEVMSNIYLYYFLSSPIAIRKVRSLAKKAVNQASISIAELKKLVIYIPEIKEQTAIAEVLTAADREIELAKEKLEYLRRQKRGLMQQLLTGKKRMKY